MVFSLSLVWIAALLAYLTSHHQGLMTKPIAKSLGWPIAGIMFVSACALGTLQFKWFVSVIIHLTALMLIWPTIVFTAPHSNLKVAPFTVFGLLFFVLIGLTGG